MSAAGSTAGSAAAAAAADKARREREEEEEMTKYDGGELEGWEFKIMRSTWGSFNKPEVVQRLCQEEARAGWEMLEKFDNYRIRFKRKIEHRAGDRTLGFDPYRTYYRGSGNTATIVFISIGIAIALGALIFFMLVKK